VPIGEIIVELLYYIDMTEEYYARTNGQAFSRAEEDLHQQFLFQLGKTTGELGISPVNLELFHQAHTNSNRVFLSFQNPEDAMAFKLKWI